jgi:hypothetical protein
MEGPPWPVHGSKGIGRLVTFSDDATTPWRPSQNQVADPNEHRLGTENRLGD